MWFDKIDDRLPETEWPCLAVATLDDSLVAKESGRGMNSKVSEKPTRARFDILSGEEGCEACPRTRRLAAVSSAFGNEAGLSSKTDGVVGALMLPDLIIMERSWHETAADLRWA